MYVVEEIGSGLQSDDTNFISFGMFLYVLKKIGSGLQSRLVPFFLLSIYRHVEQVFAKHVVNNLKTIDMSIRTMKNGGNKTNLLQKNKPNLMDNSI